MNSKTARHLRKAIADFHSDFPLKNLTVVKTKHVPYIAGTSVEGMPQYAIRTNETLAHTDCQRALYQAAKRGRINLSVKHPLNPSVSSLLAQ